MAELLDHAFDGPDAYCLNAQTTYGMDSYPLSDEGLPAPVIRPPPAGAQPPPSGVLTKLKVLDLSTLTLNMSPRRRLRRPGRNARHWHAESAQGDRAQLGRHLCECRGDKKPGMLHSQKRQRQPPPSFWFSHLS